MGSMQRNGDTALHLAAAGGHLETVDALLAKGARMEATSEVMPIMLEGRSGEQFCQ